MVSPHLLALGLDPTLILRAQGLTPDPWQRELLLAPDPRVLLNCSRGAGKSRTCSVLALHAALFQPGSLVLLLARALRQASELLHYVKQAYQALQPPVPTVRRSLTCLEWSNGSRILALPGREATIRSYQGVRLLLIDEAARVPDELYYSVRPMLNVSRGRLICLSTPFGARGFFWKEWHDAAAPWKRVCIPWHQCPRIDPAALAEERRAMGAAWVAQEYECSFVTMEGLVYPQFADTLVECVQAPPGRAVGGIDFGWRNPFAAVWGVLDGNDVLWITGERHARAVPLHVHAAALRDLGPITWYADPAGRTEMEELRAAGLKVLRGTNALRAGITAVNARIHTGRLKVVRARCPALCAEALLYRYPTGAERTASEENPLDANNHALAALRYLISRLDEHFLARLRQGRPEAQPRDRAPPLLVDNDALWNRLS